MIYIYYSYIAEDNCESLIKNELPKFSSDFQNRIKSYRRWQDAQLSLLGRIILFKAVDHIYNGKFQSREIEQTQYNKPYFKNGSIQFNISHSGEIVVCALCEKSQVGIDIEFITDVLIDDCKWQMTENEWLTLTSSDKIKEAFFGYWTQKEAVIKANGLGLSIPLKTFEVLEETAIIKGQKFFLKEIEIDEKYKCYIALDREIDQICVRKI
ncbi:4'-phosphopantetheinyl transferase family protein [Flavobacterium johnsoniae]|uniref:4'-phosphopantetheinyl transferase n=1 Tax=Flavobacterium johnsoniae (strain ATCC 17061 / DSM 2064 / JCM 8514 / BCRC 14874 / CCUG 350202 / NBRC 14942 / NCIMB 11054 / UW101) TaxID=376686 RepID=A5FI46_FLAJ1|nr:4'-phosphopantetheinyl transferase superfamily protein [Flavobacterium johnsoniae]ABQ05116.1 4'-phosphopantetheinyl transferase [Flavobacterium johnsoniae UW101]OXG00311.1 4-phosphopantetheinyl transferase [Flavobacterium johnsoniae UW101]WQG83081.1 4'-phosphopantetheinyl transferase superfamily protein [Flavobacterium johnsoniae UW101]SHL92178.1 4'-phosphopantetheinyl transferase [Flavobacterium johnsoniae]